MKTKLFFLVAVFFSFCAVVKAQSYEIRAVNKGAGFIGVEMRITAGTPPAPANFLTDLVFGVKWLASYRIDLVSSITTSYNIIKSDVRKTKGIYNYQAFSAANTPFAFPETWVMNNWVEILSIRNTLTGNGFGDFTVAELGFDVTTEPNFGRDLVDVTPSVAGNATGVPLPVTLTSFEAIAKKTTVVVTWSTAAEQNNKGFDIERSTKESSDYKKIGWVDSKGAGPNKYEWIDKDVSPGIKYYYRLKQIDRDDKFQYSAIRMVQLEADAFAWIQLRPNPADKILQVVFGRRFDAGKAVIKITDAKGVLVLTKQEELIAGRTIDLSIYSLPAGQYFLYVTDDKGKIYSKAFAKR